MPTIYWVGPTPARPLQGCVHHPLVHESADLALPCVRAEGVGGESIADLLRFSGYDLPGLALPAGRDDRLHGRDGSGPERLEYIGVPLKPRLEQKRVLTERPRGAKASLFRHWAADRAREGTKSREIVRPARSSAVSRDRSGTGIASRQLRAASHSRTMNPTRPSRRGGSRECALSPRDVNVVGPALQAARDRASWRM